MPTPEQFTQMMRGIANVCDGLIPLSSELQIRTSDGLKLANGCATANVALPQEMVNAVMTTQGARVTEIIAQIKQLAALLP